MKKYLDGFKQQKYLRMFICGALTTNGLILASIFIILFGSSDPMFVPMAILGVVSGVVGIKMMQHAHKAGR